MIELGQLILEETGVVKAPWRVSLEINGGRYGCRGETPRLAFEGFISALQKGIIPEYQLEKIDYAALGNL